MRLTALSMTIDNTGCAPLPVPPGPSPPFFANLIVAFVEPCASQAVRASDACSRVTADLQLQT